MSLILDALNRSQRDLDNLETVPGLETIHPVEAMSGTNRVRVGMVVLLFCFTLGIAILLFMGMRGSSDIEEIAITPPVVSAPSTMSKSPVTSKSVASQEAVFTEPVPVRYADQRPTIVGLPAVETTQTSAVAALYQTPKRQYRPAADRSPGQTTAKVVSVTPQPLQPQKIDIDEVLSRAKAGLETVQIKEHSAPFITELSQQVKDSIPTIYYSIHDYSSQKASSYAVLNGTRVTAGQSFGGKLSVEEILPDSIVLNMGGTQFRLKALNSWVNL